MTQKDETTSMTGAPGKPGVRSQLCKVYPANEAPYDWKAAFYTNGIPEDCGGQEATVKPSAEDR